ncbi:MAG: hypothetical protein KKE16_01120 [Firmicutes bacterium]|nr:hypothetical protein [Bacillota bacterium]
MGNTSENLIDQFWATIFHSKFYIEYIELLMKRYSRITRWMNIFAAFVASSSVAAWTIWSQLSLLWTILIVAAEALHIIRSYLPFDTRIKVIKELSHELSILDLNFERNWKDVSIEKKSDDEVNSMIFDFRIERERIMFKYIQEDVLPDVNRLINKATKHIEKELNYYYNISEEKHED